MFGCVSLLFFLFLVGGEEGHVSPPRRGFLVKELVEVFVAQYDTLFADGEIEVFVFRLAVQLAELVECGCGDFQIVLLQERAENFLTVLLCLPGIPSEDGLYFRLGFGGGCEVDP